MLSILANVSKNLGITSSIVHLAKGPNTFSINHPRALPAVSIIGFSFSITLAKPSKNNGIAVSIV